MLQPLTDYGILLSIAQDDERAYTGLFHAYHQQLGSFVFSVTRSKELTEEIIQDVFVKIWEDRKALPSVKNFSAYLFIITRNHTLNTIRKIDLQKKKEATVNQYYAIMEEAQPAPAENYYALLENAVDQLPIQQKKVYLLKRQGLKNADVAFQMDISVNSVKKYQQWAMQAIARIIKTGPFTGLLVYFSVIF